MSDPVTRVEDILNGLRADFLNHNTTIAAQASEIAALRTDNAAQAVEIATLRTDNAAQATEIATLRQNIAAQAAQVAALLGNNQSLRQVIDTIHGMSAIDPAVPAADVVTSDPAEVVTADPQSDVDDDFLEVCSALVEDSPQKEAVPSNKRVLADDSAEAARGTALKFAKTGRYSDVQADIRARFPRPEIEFNVCQHEGCRNSVACNKTDGQPLCHLGHSEREFSPNCGAHGFGVMSVVDQSTARIMVTFTGPNTGFAFSVKIMNMKKKAKKGEAETAETVCMLLHCECERDCSAQTLQRLQESHEFLADVSQAVAFFGLDQPVQLGCFVRLTRSSGLIPDSDKRTATAQVTSIEGDMVTCAFRLKTVVTELTFQMVSSETDTEAETGPAFKCVDEGFTDVALATPFMCMQAHVRANNAKGAVGRGMPVPSTPEEYYHQALCVGPTAPFPRLNGAFASWFFGPCFAAQRGEYPTAVFVSKDITLVDVSESVVVSYAGKQRPLLRNNRRLFTEGGDVSTGVALTSVATYGEAAAAHCATCHHSPSSCSSSLPRVCPDCKRRA